MSKLALSNPIPVRIPADLLENIDRIAAATERTRSWVIVRALKLYLAGEGGDMLAIVDGRAEAASNGGHDANTVLAELDDLIRSKVA